MDILGWLVICLLHICKISSIEYLEELKVEENTAINTVIVDVKLLIEQKIQHSLTEDTTFYPSHVENFLPFKLNGSQIVIGAELDREMLCKDSDSASKSEDQSCEQGKCCKDLYFNVLTSKVDPPMVYAIKVTVLDQNDNLPTFDKHQGHTVEVKENTKVGTLFPLPIAKDSDSPVFSVSNYQITNWVHGNRSHFDLEVIDKVGYLRVSKPLDREQISEYSFTYTAFDRDLYYTSETNESSIQIDIKILDVNDNAPKFDKDHYFVIIQENEVSRKILDFTLTDADVGVNSDIKVDFDEGNEYSKIFHIITRQDYQSNSPLRNEREKGKRFNCYLQLVDRIDAERLPEKFTLKINAIDRGQPELKSSVNVTINVLNVNDNPPEVDFFRNGNKIINGRMDVVEHETVKNSLIAIVHVTDKDSPKDHIKCQLINEINEFSLEELPQQGMPYKAFILRNKNELDWEYRNTYRISIECNDMDPKIPLTKKSNLQLTVKDINDNGPTFDRKSYNAFVNENAVDVLLNFRPQMPVVYDKDSEENSKIIYSILPNYENKSHVMDHEYFRIDPASGKITVISPLDAEVKSLYLLTINAQDKPVVENGSIHKTSATARVHVEDVNDHQPTFREPLYKFEVKENNKAGSLIGRVVAHDEDVDEKNRKIIYKITGTPEDMAFFDVDKYSGEIRTRRPIDYEKKQHFFFTILAVNDNIRRSEEDLLPQSTAQIQIDVLNENDNNPEFYLIDQQQTILIFPLMTVVSHNNESKLCEQIPYHVRDPDNMVEGTNFNCCTVRLLNDYNGLFTLREGSMLCIDSKPKANQTSYKISLEALDNDLMNPLKSIVHFTVIFQSNARKSANSRWPSDEDRAKVKNGSKYEYDKFELSSKQTTIFIVLAVITILLCLLLIGLILTLRRCRHINNTLDQQTYYNNKNLKHNYKQPVDFDYNSVNGYNYPEENNYQQLNYNKTYTIPRSVIIRKHGHMNNADGYQTVSDINNAYILKTQSLMMNNQNQAGTTPKNYLTMKTRMKCPTNQMACLPPNSPSSLSGQPNYRLNNFKDDSIEGVDKLNDMPDTISEHVDDFESKKDKLLYKQKNNNDINSLFQTSFV